MQAKVEPTLDPVYQTVLWLSDTSISRNEQLARRIAAIALAVLLTFTIIGIYFVLKGIHIWSKLNSGDGKIERVASRELHPPPHQHEGRYPEPYAKLRNMELYNEEDLAPIREKLKRARTRGNQMFYPRSFPALITAVGSEEKARMLFDEGLILIHYICLNEYDGMEVNPIDYKKFVIPYMDMLFSYLLENQKFPDNIYEGWALD